MKKNQERKENIVKNQSHIENQGENKIIEHATESFHEFYAILEALNQMEEVEKLK